MKYSWVELVRGMFETYHGGCDLPHEAFSKSSAFWAQQPGRVQLEPISQC